MPDLSIALIQTELHWQNPQANRRLFEEMVKNRTEKVDLIIFPEMFTTGFTMEAAQWAEPMDGPTVNWLRQLAMEQNVHLIGSLIITEGKHYYNRLIWAERSGTIHFYDKRHLFRMAGEHKVYQAGQKWLTVKVQGWKIRPFICYDLRFPVWSRNVQLAYDLAIYVANWPQRRRQAWRTLLQARAAENQAYVVGVNRIGSDGLDIQYAGDSMVVDPVGNILFDAQDRQGVFYGRLSHQFLSEFRQKFPTWKDADRFEIQF